MLYSYMDQKIAEARIDTLIEEAKEGRLVKQAGRKQALRLPSLSNLFANLKMEKQTAVATQA
ncbi:MAG: hypothetical protein H6652_00755 [Ardenticatenaceae bacterium]|nr:hypothetical protein [Ardenticatenaceae bacterium]